ncbi:SLC13 family permease [Lyngbya confervoides]|uniref:SLC13 family permease n=1 Tax=Lyngbya confervoides BDU141951 TaxID=1574623 RepID=A0ABD4T088_9CYAN|nr:SLC13 family permease [Lyngbya confervoides]MCM1982081.1 SLC13 family permease [Lyngbya confervoides BDU141951]
MRRAHFPRNQRWLGQRGAVFVVLMGLGAGVGLAIAAAQAGSFSWLTGMNWQAWLSIAVTLMAFLGNALTPLPAEIVFLGAAAVLFLTGVLDEKTALSGFSNSGMITVAVLYIVVTGLQQTGALVWVSQQVLGMPKTESRALVRLMLPVMGISAFLNNTPVVAMFIPVVDDWCRKLRFSPSKLMLPLSYAAIFGGLFTLIGTSTNLVVNGLLMDATQGPGLKLLDIAWVGIPCGMVGFVFLLVAQRWLLPERKAALSDTDDLRQYTVEMRVVPESPIVGKSIEKAGLRHLPHLYLAEVRRGDQLLPAIGPQQVLQGDDQLLFVGVVDSILDLQRIRGLEPATDQVFKLEEPRTDRCLIEAVVSNTCPLIGQTIRESRFRSQYNAVVVAVARNGDRLMGKIGDIRLDPGDTLLLEASPSFVRERRISRDFYLVSSIPNSEPMRHDRSPWAFGFTLAMVIVAALGWMSMLQAATLAAIGMLVLGCCSPRQAIRSIEWSVLLVIGAALALGAALESTGAAAAIAHRVIALAGDNPWLVLAALYAVTTVLTEVITNNAAAALIFPISLALAKQLNVSDLPFVIAIMIAASASFATPIGYQTNLMVYGPGGYKFTDFLRIGVPLNLIYGIVTVAITPLVYPF